MARTKVAGDQRPLVIQSASIQQKNIQQTNSADKLSRQTKKQTSKEEGEAMTIQQMERRSTRPSEEICNLGSSFQLCRENQELLLAAVTLVALLIGCVGGSLVDSRAVATTRTALPS